MKKSGKQEIRGADDIYEYLLKLNKNVRDQEKVIISPGKLTLSMHCYLCLYCRVQYETLLLLFLK